MASSCNLQVAKLHDQSLRSHLTTATHTSENLCIESLKARAGGV